MKKLDFWLTEWAEHQVNIMHRCGYSGVNIIEKILKDPGISTGGSKHRVLWWPKNKRIAQMSRAMKNKRIAQMSRAMHQISPYSRLCLVVEYGRIVQQKNGQILTKKEFCAKRGHSCAFFDECVRDAKNKLRVILRGYTEGGKKKKKKA
jgi:hypothetical protein